MMNFYPDFLKSIACFAILGFATSALANDQDDRRRQSEWQPTPPPTALTPNAPPAQVGQGRAVEMSEKELLANPELLTRAMFSALVYNNADNVALLLPIYKRQKSALIDDELVWWAMAVLNTAEQDFNEAVKKYRALYKKHPKNPIIAVRLGQAYFANRNYADAKAIFLAQPADIQSELSPYLVEIARLEKLNIHANSNFLSDKNINNAPQNSNLGGGWTANAPESANGVFVNVGAGKRIFLAEGAFLHPEIDLNGKWYWDSKHYNEAVVRASLGVGKGTASEYWSVSPFYERTHYAGGQRDKHKLAYFSDAVGVSFDAGKQAGQWRVNVGSELAQNSYADRKHLNGYSLSVSPTVSVSPAFLGSRALASVGADYQYTSTRDRDDSYQRTGVRFSAVKEWQSVGVRGSLGIAKRQYFAPMPIFNKVQENNEYQGSLSIWHNRLSYKTLTPRLTWQYQKTDSSIPLYSYDKNRVFVEIQGGF